jgi:diguanylate cyclase (GGDEF)-like protein
VERPCRVLIVDDNPTNVVVLVKSLERAGHEVRAVGNGFEAVDVATSYLPDVILLDMMLPGRDGLEVCTILKDQEATSAIPIIFVTAVSEAGQVLRAFEAGGSDYVTKPFRTAEVLARVSVQARLRRAETALIQKNAQTEQLATELAEANVRLAHLSRSDPLTDLLNRRALEEAAGHEHKRYKRRASQYSILMIDVDHFKAFNDTQGHQAGDQCLRRVARAISSACRGSDYLGRYGGEEFAVLAPDTNAESALKLGERIRKVVWNLSIPHMASTVGDRLTVSVGVATAGAGSWESVLKRADEALYVAKRAGRNMVYTDHRVNPHPDEVDQGQADQAPEPVPETAGTRTVVLVADDNPTDRVLCRGCLEKEGYDVREVADGNALLACVAEMSPDVIIMDVVMPGMDGLECTRRLKADPGTHDIPIIMVSARLDGEAILAGLEAGADEYLTKPIRKNELLVRIRAAVRHYAEHKDLLRSYEFRGEQTRVLQCLLDYARAAGESATPDDILDRALAVTAEVTGSRRISIMLPDPDQRYLTIARCVGMDRDIASSIRVPVGELIAGKAFASHRPVVVNSEQDAALREPAYDSHFFTGVPLAAMPLGTPDQAIGVLSVTDRTSGQPFRHDDVEYLDLIAGITGSTIQNRLSCKTRNQARDGIMVALAKLAEHRDADTGRHVDRVTRYSLILAAELADKPGYRDELDAAFLRDLERAVPLHDIGKVAIPEGILLKPGSLTVEEMSIMRTHTEIGAETIQSVVERAPGASFLKMALDIARAHHEWYDGSGYPCGLSRQAIPLSARIVGLVDVYDALTTNRVYKEAIHHDKAVTIITELSGAQFDPGVVEAFLTHEPEFARLASELTDDRAEPTPAPDPQAPETRAAMSATDEGT